MSVDGTIAALATPPGEGAIAVVRVSGPDAFAIASRVFRGPELKPRTATFGRIVDGGGVVDEVVATAFAGPASYTGEDVVEISGHGGILVAARVLETVLAAGARAAGPGEFSQRAFLNGKMDLTQAEAVMDLIRAQTPRAARAAVQQMAGRIGEETRQIADAILDVVAHLEAFIDFPDEDIAPESGEQFRERISAARQRIDALLATAEEGRILREGVRLAICGRPNAGKSSLLNRLVGYDRAIVSAVPGTTRDTVEETISLRGIPFRVVDTAGLRESDDAVEQEGMRRTRAAVAEADVVIHLVDATEPAHDPPHADGEILVVNKVDLAASSVPGAVAISCATGEGLDLLVATLLERVSAGNVGDRESLAAINARHQGSLTRANDALAQAAAELESGVAPEFVAIELRLALEAVGEVTGMVDIENILGRIFSTFCIGK